MSNKPFQAEQFTPTKCDTAQDKALWANRMASWVRRGFPPEGWTKGLYTLLRSHLYGHIAHYNKEGFYAEWFADIHRQLAWLTFAREGGWLGYVGDPRATWSDVEEALSAWIREQGLVETYQQLCAADIQARERARLNALQEIDQA